jgi:hypothetical protein
MLPPPQLLDTIQSTKDAYHKLTIIVGGPGSGKTVVLNQVAKELGLPVINLSLHLSQRLLSKSRQQMALHAADMATDVVDEHYTTGLCIDNTELLFDRTLQLDPLAWLEDLSRNRLIVATWNGTLVGGELRFGNVGHPDHFSRIAKGYPIVSVKENELELHLTA